MSTCLSVTLAACAGGATPPAALDVSCRQALLRLEQVSTPGFEQQDQSPSPPPTPQRSARTAAGVQPGSAAEVHYFRPTRDLATSNGPVEISARAVCYRDSAEASQALASLERERAPGEVPLSAGELGDEARASRRRAMLPSGTAVAQITIHWRLSLVLNTLTVRGREGAFGLGEVVALAARQQENELAIATASATGPGGASPGHS